MFEIVDRCPKSQIYASGMLEGSTVGLSNYFSFSPSSFSSFLPFPFLLSSNF